MDEPVCGRTPNSIPEGDGRLGVTRSRADAIAPTDHSGGPNMLRILPMTLVTVAILGMPDRAAADSQVDRGKYLVTIGGCSDCHTPGSFLGHPDMSRYLGGSDVGFGIPGVGVAVGRNLTPDKETG